MVRHIILLFFRSFGRHKSTSIINLIGLSIGLACALLIYFWIYDETNFDKFHKNDRSLYKVMINDHNPGGITTRDAASANLADALKIAFPEVKYAVTTTPDSWFRTFSVSRDNKTIVKSKGNFVGKDYFKVFSFDLVKGDENSILSVKNSIAISDELAMKLFKTTEVIGQTLDWKWFSYGRQSVITGVYKKPPQNSTYQFDFVLPLESWNDIMPGTIDPNIADLSGGPFNTFLVLTESSDKDRLGDKISALGKSKIPGSASTFFLAKYSDYYLHGNYENGMAVGGRIQYVRLFSVIAIFILLIACINFMNLSTARSSERMKEIGIKKTLGISRNALILQFISESLITAFISLGVALLLVALLLPYFS
ncbi:MAG TPA: ABC transporter permease, partial [Flavitalea sp.]|nr:ABC transporter permease [Flavitalea sp.]